MPIKGVHSGTNKRLVTLPMATFVFGRAGDGKHADVNVDDITNSIPVSIKGIPYLWTINGDVAPTGAAGTVDILYNGVSIFGYDSVLFTHADRLVTIPDGANPLTVYTGNIFDPDTSLLTEGFVVGKVLQAKVIQVGSTVKGKSWTVRLHWR